MHSCGTSHFCVTVMEIPAGNNLKRMYFGLIVSERLPLCDGAGEHGHAAQFGGRSVVELFIL